MFFIEKTIEFDKWLKKLKDFKGKAKILFRIQKIESDGHFGDCKPVCRQRNKGVEGKFCKRL